MVWASWANGNLVVGWWLWVLSLGIVVWGQSRAKNRAQSRKEMKSRCTGKAMQKQSLYSLE